MALDTAATMKLRCKETTSVGFERNRWYHSVVNPSRGKLGPPSLKENTVNRTIGR